MPRAFTENEKKIIIQALMEQGKKQFSAYGLKKANVEEIARAAGISKGAFYLFFNSKEELFWKIVELVEDEFRVHALESIQKSDGEPRVRLTNVLMDMFNIWREIPLLHFFSNADYQILLRGMPDSTMAKHLQSDMKFMYTMFRHLAENGIQIKISPEIFMNLMYAMFLVTLHGDDLGEGGLESGKMVLLELIAAYSLGEISLEAIDLTKFVKELS